jgi:D-alanyl-D-alanine dipeptidase
MMSLVEITPEDFDVDICLAYGTTNNFTRGIVYRKPQCFLHRDAADRLAKASDLARVHGRRLRIFDAYRPTEAQWVLWSHFPDANFVADPRIGSPHSRGVAVDLTMVGESGEELDMGTGFDDFTARSHHGSTAVSLAAQRNRFFLLGLMLSAGWQIYPNEWWHYHVVPFTEYPLLSDSTLREGMM